MQGRLIAENITRHSKNKQLISYSTSPTPLVVDLDGNGILIWNRLVVGSRIFSWLKKIIELKEMLELKRQ